MRCDTFLLFCCKQFPDSAGSQFYDFAALSCKAKPIEAVAF